MSATRFVRPKAWSSRMFSAHKKSGQKSSSGPRYCDVTEQVLLVALPPATRTEKTESQESRAHQRHRHRLRHCCERPLSGVGRGKSTCSGGSKHSEHLLRIFVIKLRRVSAGDFSAST